MIRFCPNCETERPLSEIFCEGIRQGATCNWDLTSAPIRSAGSRPETAEVPVPTERTCPQGHPVEEGDVICFTCGTDLRTDVTVEVSALSPADNATVETPPRIEVTEIAGWQLIRRFATSNVVSERFHTQEPESGKAAVLTLYADGAEPDPAVYDVIRNLPRDHVQEILDIGRWNDRAYEVAEEITGGSLTELGHTGSGLDAIRRLVSEIGGALHAFSNSGLRHRDLHPGNIIVRTKNPLDLVVTGFGSARLSHFDLDVVSPLETTRYMAPEAIAGGVAAASDWWSLGMIVLEQATAGACFEGVNQQAFLIHVLTNGVPIPSDLDASVEVLLRGLLARDHRKRWQWKEVRGWLEGEEIPVPPETASVNESSGRVPIALAGTSHHKAAKYALAAAEAVNWDEARDQLARGAVATWVEDAELDSKIRSGIRQLAHIDEISDDLRLSLGLKVLNPAMPLIAKGNIVTPGWLLDHPEEGYNLIAGPAPDFLKRIDAEPWLGKLKERVATVRARARQLGIELNEDDLRINLLSTSKARLSALWDDRRRLFPDTDHPGLVSLIERRQTTEEDFILLLSAVLGQFRSVQEILEEARDATERAGVTTFRADAAEEMLASSRRDIHRMIDERLTGFARCNIARVDEWADQFRLDRRMPIGRALALLSVPEESWVEPPKQAYVSTLLDYFAKKISGSILRGPLTRMLIGKSTPRVDLMELGSERRTAPAILDQILARTDHTIDIDPDVFVGPETLERRLRSLHAHSTLYKRDTGIDGLYLGFPILLMRDVRGNTRTRIAPVLLWPVKINPQVGNRGHVSVSFDRDRDEVRLNPAFEGMIGIEASRRWLDAASDLLGRASFTAADVMDAFGTKLASVRNRELKPVPGRETEVEPGRPEVECSAVFFHLAYMGQAVVEDLRQLKGIPPAGTALETALRVTTQDWSARETPAVPENDRYFTVASDPSQEAAVLEARGAPGLLIEGPPGTGKSQTIVNMVADAIGRKKSLLVVCQKQAALEVVKKRLEAEGLGERIVMISDMNRDREPTIRAVREQLETLFSRPRGGAPLWKREREMHAARIHALETELDQHHAALHQVDEATGGTYRTLLGELIALEAGARPALEVTALRRLFADLDPFKVAELEETCGAQVQHWLPAKYEGSPLSVLKSFTLDAATASAFSDDFEALRRNESYRAEVVERTLDAIPLSDPEPYRKWFNEHDSEFRSMSAATRNELARWLQLCHRDASGQSDVTNLSKTLLEVERKLREVEHSSVLSKVSHVAVSLSDQALEQSVKLAASVTAPVSGIGRFNPLRWNRKRQLRGFLEEHKLGDGPEDIASFLTAGQMEQMRRPLRDRLRSLLSTIREDGLVARDAAARDLADIASHRSASLGVCQHLADAVSVFPDPLRLETIVSSGSLEAYEALKTSAEHAFERCEARQFSRAALDNLSPWFEETWLDERRAEIDADGSTSDAILKVAESLPALAPYQRFRIRASRIGENAMRVFGVLRSKDALLAEIPDAQLESETRRIIAREARLAWKARIEADNPTLLYETGEIQSKIRALAEADLAMRRTNRDLLIEGIDVGRIRPLREWEDITRLRGQRARRLREFLDRGTDLGLMELRPVWLMNPDVASRVLPLRGAMFDVVIYDESSQMPVEYSLPTLFRGDIVIVSGDEKQMPPTAFFSSKVENDEADIFDGEELEENASDEDRDIYTEIWNRREIKDCPDLLQLARTVLPSTTLQIHYRSAYRELIGFSNASFYGNRLNVPVKHPDDEVRRARPIELVRVDGIYSDQTNRMEADKVVELLAELWSRDSAPPTVGVVTFNRKQADLIEEVLEERAENDADFRVALARERERIEDGEDMGFFVKNVENVQGDERDVIMFSSTYGRNGQGTFRRNFGVLGQKGGQRRLNVAVTRARSKVVMVTSIPIAEISDMLSSRRPPSAPRDFLQGYLEYARAISAGEFESGRTLLLRLATEHGGEKERVATEQDGFSDSVASFLREQGWRPQQAHDGGAFGLDFAIEDPRTGLFGIGIECDAPRHRILETARAREVWRPKVLGRAIPRIHRVSSHGWFHNKTEERARLRTAVIEALGHGACR